MSPREYQARLDLLRVQDCVWARMKPSEIARKLGKDKAWVSRAIRKLEVEGASAFRSPVEIDLVGENLSQLDSLLAKTLRAADEESDARTRLAALRTAADVLRQKTEYQMAVGLVQSHRHRVAGENGEPIDRAEVEEAIEFQRMMKEEVPLHSCIKIVELLANKPKFKHGKA